MNLKVSGDILTFVIAAIVLVGGFLMAGMVYWAIFWLGAFLWLALMEYLSVKRTGQTLSEALATAMRLKPIKGWALWALLALGFLSLLYHFIALAY